MIIKGLLPNFKQRRAFNQKNWRQKFSLFSRDPPESFLFSFYVL